MQSNSFNIKLFNYLKIFKPTYIFYALPILILIKIISPVIVVRFDLLISDRIGHLVENYLLYKLKKINNYENSNKLFFDIFFFKKRISNSFFAKYLKNNLFICPRFLLKPIWELINILSLKTKIFDRHFAYIKKNKKDGYEYYNPNHKSIMSLSKKDIIYGQNFLNQIGIKKNMKFVCLNIHDNSYLEKEFPNENWNHHNVRISNIDNYMESIKFLNSKDIFVIRMGRQTKKRLTLNSKLFYDYSFSNLQNDMLDFFLISNCYFYFSNNTGLDNVALLFNKPMLKSSHSFIHLDTENHKNILFFNFHYDKKNKKFLNYKEVMKKKSNYFSIYKTEFFKELHIELIENNKNEIKSYTEEMVYSMEDKLNYSDIENALMHEFWKEYKNYCLSAGNSYYSENQIKSNISYKYLLNQFKKSKNI